MGIRGLVARLGYVALSLGWGDRASSLAGRFADDGYLIQFLRQFGINCVLDGGVGRALLSNGSSRSSRRSPFNRSTKDMVPYTGTLRRYAELGYSLMNLSVVVRGKTLGNVVEYDALMARLSLVEA